MAEDPIRARLDTFIVMSNADTLALRYRDALRAVLDLHALGNASGCGCGYGITECPTRRIIAEHLGVTDEDWATRTNRASLAAGEEWSRRVAEEASGE